MKDYSQNMKTRVLSRAEILDQLKVSFPDEKGEVLKEASYNLSLASTNASQMVERMHRAVERIKATPMRQFQPLPGGRRTEANVCPICRFEMKTVNLMENRPAWYCQEHKVIVPHPIDDLSVE